LKEEKDRKAGKIVTTVDDEKKRKEEEKKRQLLEKQKNKKFKEIMKQHRGRDKRATYAFLIKHGLTEKEAREYTQLTQEFSLERLSVEQRDFLQHNFDAQVFAFRKMREKLILEDNAGQHMYKKDRSKIKGDRSLASMDKNEITDIIKQMSKGKNGPTIVKAGVTI